MNIPVIQQVGIILGFIPGFNLITATIKFFVYLHKELECNRKKQETLDAKAKDIDLVGQALLASGENKTYGDLAHKYSKLKWISLVELIPLGIPSLLHTNKILKYAQKSERFLQSIHSSNSTAVENFPIETKPIDNFYADYVLIGHATVIEKSRKKEVKITIHKLINPEGKIILIALKDNRSVGKISFYHVRENGFQNKSNLAGVKKGFGHENKSFCLESELKYDDLRGEISRIHIDYMPTFGKYLSDFQKENFETIEAVLIQSAIEVSKQLGCEGRVTLDSSDTFHLFHYKMGFRSEDPEINQQLKQRSELIIDISPAGCSEKISMYLPIQTISTLWDPKINIKPIIAERPSS